MTRRTFYPLCLAVVLLLPDICSAGGSVQKLASIIDTLVETRDFSGGEVDRLFNQTLSAMSDGANSDALIGGVPEKLLTVRLGSKIAGILIHRFTEHSKGRDILTNVRSIYSTIDSDNAEIMEELINRKLTFLQRKNDGHAIELASGQSYGDLPGPGDNYDPGAPIGVSPIGMSPTDTNGSYSPGGSLLEGNDPLHMFQAPSFPTSTTSGDEAPPLLTFNERDIDFP